MVAMSPAARQITVLLDGLPKGLNGSHGHWKVAAKRRRVWRARAGWLAKKQMLARGWRQPFAAATIRCVRHSSTHMDYDNLVAGFKPIIDGLVDGGVIADDSDAVIVGRQYAHAVAPLKHGFVEVTVTEVQPQPQEGDSSVPQHHEKRTVCSVRPGRNQRRKPRRHED